VCNLTASVHGAGQLPCTVADNVAQGMELLSSTTGVDLAQLLQGLAGRGTAKIPEQVEPSTPAPAEPSRIKVDTTE
jgi:flotillin